VVEHRDAASDSVRVRGKDDQRVTIGTKAASKLLVQIARVLLLVVALGGTASAQDPRTAPQPFAITDNSMLIEEAFNQDAGVVQNIFQLAVSDASEWVTNFTQEWPLFSHRHQISYTLTYESIGGASGLTDTQVHYRLQVRDEGRHAPAISPRVTVFLPTGNSARALGEGNPGWQMNLPISKQFGDFYVHWNAGFTHSPAAKVDGREWNLLALSGGASVIWRMRPMLHLMLESVAVSDQEVEGGSTARHGSVIVSPGLRGGWNIGDAQLVLALGVPITRAAGSTNTAVITYFSYELPFRK
jgi:hypothetical protein